MSEYNELFENIPEHYTVKHIIDNFDFESVESYMRSVNWAWLTLGPVRSPNVNELKKCAQRLLEDARASHVEHMFIATGGFTVYKLYNQLYLHFSVSESSDEYDENRID